MVGPVRLELFRMVGAEGIEPSTGFLRRIMSPVQSSQYLRYALLIHFKTLC